MDLSVRVNVAPGDAALRAVEKAAAEGVGDAVEALLTDSNQTVPHDEGTLERSGSASVDGLTGAVSYSTPYAVRQHEELDYRHPGKGRAKWLERTMSERGRAYFEHIAARIRKAVG